MKEERKLTDHLSFEEVKRFLDAKIPNGFVCPICKANDWGHAEEAATSEVLGFSIIDGRKQPNGLYPLLITYCMNCGFVAPHVKGTIIKWLNDSGGHE